VVRLRIMLSARPKQAAIETRFMAFSSGDMLRFVARLPLTTDLLPYTGASSQPPDLSGQMQAEAWRALGTAPPDPARLEHMLGPAPPSRASRAPDRLGSHLVHPGWLSPLFFRSIVGHWTAITPNGTLCSRAKRQALGPAIRTACSRAARQKAINPAQASRMTSSASCQGGWKERPHSTVKLRILPFVLSTKCRL
jgi:hypothetical protein